MDKPTLRNVGDKGEAEMFHLFRSAGEKDGEVGEASRRNDEAYEELKEALRRLLSERNQPGLASTERDK
jgi:hypothetical protein